jgi:hypothetical protein
LMHVETMNVYEPTDFERELRRLAWAVEMARATSSPPSAWRAQMGCRSR